MIELIERVYLCLSWTIIKLDVDIDHANIIFIDLLASFYEIRPFLLVNIPGF